MNARDHSGPSSEKTAGLFDEIVTSVKRAVRERGGGLDIPRNELSVLSREIAGDAIIYWKSQKEDYGSVWNFVTNRISAINLLSSAKAKSKTVPLTPGIEESLVTRVVDETEFIAIDTLKEQCSDRDRFIIRRLEEEASLQTIAKELGISKTAVYAVKNRLAKHLHSLELGQVE